MLSERVEHGVKLVFQGPLNVGSTTLQRFQAFASLPGVTAVPLDAGAKFGTVGSLYQRLRWKLRLPVDVRGENAALEQVVAAQKPDVVFVDNSRVIRRATLRRLRALGTKALVYYTPDNVVAPHNQTWPLRRTFPDWDLFFTTKSFNVSELAERGVRRPILIGNAFDPAVHRPMTREEVGNDYERFDLVFMGHYEEARRRSLNALAEAGFSIVIYGGTVAGWKPSLLHGTILLRDAQYGQSYARGMHHGKIALCFLRKLNRDRITTRSIEIGAMGRPMLAEKTDEHDAHFIDGQEYMGFSDDYELIEKARMLLRDSDRARLLGERARARCLTSGYSTIDRGVEMLRSIAQLLS